jgi:hypothetical protein
MVVLLNEVEVSLVGLDATPKLRVGMAMAVAWWKKNAERRKWRDGRKAERGILWAWRG